MSIEKYCDRELQEMQELCVYIVNACGKLNIGFIGDIHQIALIEINRELDERKDKILKFAT